MTKKNSIIPILTILIFWFITSFYKISDRDLWSTGETREAEIAQEMIESNDYLVPKFNKEFLPWKPPLFHWMECIASVFTKKQVDSFSSRLPSSLSFLIGAFIIFFILSGITNINSRFFAAIIFLTANKSSWMSRVAQIDLMFSVLVGTALLLFFRFYYFHQNLTEKQKKSYLLLFYTVSALAVLAKGPAGIVLITGGIFLFLLFDRNLSFIPKCIDLWGLLIFVLISSSWYLTIIFIKGKEFAYEFFIVQNINRFFNAFDHKHPFTYYIAKFIGGFMPWSFFFIAGCITTINRRIYEKKIMFFSFMCFSFIFLFFSFSGSKRGVYILPLYISASILTGIYIAEFTDTSQKKVFPVLYKISSFLNATFFIILASLFFVFQNNSLRSFVYSISLPHLSEFDQIMFEKIQPFIEKHSIAMLTTSFVIFFTGIIIIVALYKKRYLLTFYITAFGILFLNLFSVNMITPLLDSQRSLKPFTLKVDDELDKNDIVYSYGIGNEDLVYYSKRKVISCQNIEDIKAVIEKKPDLIYIFTDKKYLQQFNDLNIKHKILFDTGIQQLDGVLLRIDP